MKTIEETLKDLNGELRELSLKIHGKRPSTTVSPLTSGSLFLRDTV